MIPAYDCNLRCPYCYGGNISRGGSGWTKETMTRETVEAAFVAMETLQPNLDRCKRITLYGGEPLLGSNLGIVSHIIRQGLARGHSFGAITNGFESEYYREFIGEKKIEFLQITLDGTERMHNSRRPLPSGEGTFEKIVTNISICLELGAKVTVRVNIDASNLGELSRLAELFEQKRWKKFENFSCYLSPVHAVETTWHDVTDSCLPAHPLIRKSQIAKYLKTDCQQGELVKYFSEPDSYLKRLIAPVIKFKLGFRLRPSFCGACSGMFIFDPRGDLYTCLEFVGDSASRVGVFLPELCLDPKALSSWRGRTIASLDLCKKCKYALFCGGGCGAFAKKAYGTHESRYCDEFPLTFHRNVQNAYKEYLTEQAQNEDGASLGKEVSYSG